MGKKSGSPGVFSRKGISAKPSTPAPTTTSAPVSKPAAPVSRQPTPAPTANSTAMTTKPTTAPAPQTTGAPVAAPASGGSFLGNVASSALGSFTGVMVADALFGNKEGQGQQQNGDFISPMGTNASQALSYPGNTKCQQQFVSFMKCVESNPSSVSSCQWAYDMFKSCNVNQLD